MITDNDMPTNGCGPLLIREQEYMKSSNQNKPFVIPMYSGFKPSVGLSAYTKVNSAFRLL